MTEKGLKILKVGLKNRTYPIYIGYNLGSFINEFSQQHIAQGNKVVALIDEGLKKELPFFADDLLSSVSTYILPSGESTKSIAYLSKIWDFLAKEGLDRTGVVFALGGGVTGDLAGFAAAAYLRGIEFYQIPSTLLAMVDSSVGGKTGINLDAGKNLVGSFHQPKAVFIDLNCLKTLPDREFSAGMAEIIKYGLLGNKSLYQKLLSFSTPLNSGSNELPGIIEICCLDKAKIVESDEKESIESSGGRALLNLGHTFAHAIESVAGYGEYLHGEAVSIGLVCALRLSRMSGYCLDMDELELEALLQSYALPTKLRFDLCSQTLMNAMQCDKKVKAGKIRFVMLKEIGCAFLSSNFNSDQVLKIWNSVGAK